RRSRRTLHEEAKEESVLLNPATPRGGVEPPDLLCRSPGHRSHTMTSQGDSGIEIGVDHIRDEINHDKEDREDEGGPHNSARVKPKDRLCGPVTDAFPSEHVLHEHDPAKEAREQEADHGDRGQEGVSSNMDSG